MGRERKSKVEWTGTIPANLINRVELNNENSLNPAGGESKCVNLLLADIACDPMPKPMPAIRCPMPWPMAPIQA